MQPSSLWLFPCSAQCWRKAPFGFLSKACLPSPLPYVVAEFVSLEQGEDLHIVNWLWVHR